MTRRKCSKGGDRDNSQAFTLYNKALYKRLNHELKNNCQVNDFNGSSRSQSSLAIKPTM